MVAPGDRQGVKGESPGAAGKAANLGGESPSPSITRFGRLAYLMHAKVMTHVLLRCKRHGCPGYRRRYPAVGTTWVASKLGGLKINEWLQPRNHPPVRKSLNGALWEADPWDFGEGRCDRGSKTGTCTLSPTVARAQASEERFAEITPGRAYVQQGLTTTCKDCGSEPIGRETQRM